MITLGIDIGSNSVGSAWIDHETGEIATGVSVFPAGVDESDEQRGAPKNAKRRMARRARITLARRAARKRALRRKLIDAGLLPPDASEFQKLLEQTDPWRLRQRGLDEPLAAYEFGRVLLHLAQRRGAMGLNIAAPDEREDGNTEDGAVKAAILSVRNAMQAAGSRTFGEYVAGLRAKRVTAIESADRRSARHRIGPREFRDPIRNRQGTYEHCADRGMIRSEFDRLWSKQKSLGGAVASLLTDDLRKELDDPTGDSLWRQRGLLFGQRRQSWDLGTLGRCTLEPTERCVPHADMFASQYLVVETLNNLRIIEQGESPRPLTQDERERIKAYLRGPLGRAKKRGKTADQPKTTVSVTDLRQEMGWGKASKGSRFHFNIEADDERIINTDWFSREIIHGAIRPDAWAGLPDCVRHGINRAILKYDPDDPEHEEKLRQGVATWGGLSNEQADALVSAWKSRPRPDKNRLNMSRRAVRNLLVLMDREEPWRDEDGTPRWLTQIEARRKIAADPEFRDVTTDRLLDEHARRRYATGARGATARDRYYMRKHLLRRGGELIYGPDGRPIPEPPPAPPISNPVVRKAIHEVRRHLIAFLSRFGRKPDEVYVELAREARMGARDADRLLLRNRLRNRIRNDIILAFELAGRSATQQRAAVDRVVLCVQQDGVCPLCGNQTVPVQITPRMAAAGEECEVAHIIPRGLGGPDGLSNVVLAHTKCNREMGRRTPRQFWAEGQGFENGMRWVEGIYGSISRPTPHEARKASGFGLWSCYFSARDDRQKIEQFAKDVADIQGMTPRQEAATRHAARQVMAYIADALYEGNGLPERGGERRIFTTDGIWTSRIRREWGLFFDPHFARSGGLSTSEEHLRNEKNRGDHRHHAVDAITIGLCSRRIQKMWEERERRAEADGVNTADPEQIAAYHRQNPLPNPEAFGDRDKFRETVRRAVFGSGDSGRPVAHRPVKRKLIGEFHEAFLRGPVLDAAGNFTGRFTKRISVVDLDPNHLRLPRLETETEALARLSREFRERSGLNASKARDEAKAYLASPTYKPRMVEPPPGKSGIVRDRDLRRRIRDAIAAFGLDPDDFTRSHIKATAAAGAIRHPSGVPIRSVVLLWSIADPVILSRWATDHATGKRYRQFDAATGEGDRAAARAYIGGNQHHIEIRVDELGRWSGRMISAHEAARRNAARLRAIRAAGIRPGALVRELNGSKRRELKPLVQRIEQDHPIVDRRDGESLGGRFVLSLCEGEMLWMKHKHTGEIGYFVVAKLDKPQSIVLVPHWDARAATQRKDANGNRVPNSGRDQFSVVPNDLPGLAPPRYPHAVKIRVDPLGVSRVLERD